MVNEASRSEQALKDRLADGGFAIALSGGGHRATLATLGALMAIVDRGLGDKVLQIASVSGGSITNAFLAQRVEFGRLKPFELDDAAADLTSTIVQEGVVTIKWFVILAVAVVIAGVVSGYSFFNFIWPSSVFSTVFGLAVALLVLLGRGLLVEWLIDRRFFRAAEIQPGSRHRSKALLKSISGGGVDHVFCMTDLVLGLPVYASSEHGGIIYRRLGSRQRAWSGFSFQTFDGGYLSLAELVRASAAFPGIPPRRIKFPADPKIEEVAESPRVGYLADGGIWNNLGSQVLREDKIIGTHFAWDKGVPRPYGRAPYGVPLLCINGSAPLHPTASWTFSIPGLALFKSLFQVANILNANTVLPRIDAMARSFERRKTRGERPDFLDPADLVADLKPLEETRLEYLTATWKKELIAETDDKVKNWERDALVRVRVARQCHEEATDTDWLKYLLGPHAEPEGSYPVCGLANIEDWDALWNNPAWKALVEEYGTVAVGAPTTLDRIDADLARRLIARSYLNTFLVSLFLSPLRAGEIDELEKLATRFERTVGATQ